MAIDSHHHVSAAEKFSLRRENQMVVCPVCHKATASNFMWNSSDTERMCLICHHQKKKEAVMSCSGAKLSGSKSVGGEFLVKIGGSLAAVLALFVGGICLFYKPHPMAPPKPLANSRLERNAKAGAGGTLKKDDKKTEVGKTAESGTGGAPGAKDEKKAGATIATAGAGGKKERIAPTVQALITGLPQGKLKMGTDGDTTKPGALSDAGGIASSLGIKTPNIAEPNGTTLSPAQKTKAKMLGAKDAMLTVASAVIDKNDSDGTKTADALAKLGAISTTFADVATKLTEGSISPTKPGSSGDAGGMGGFGGLGGTTGSLKLEADILETQGRAGYDVMDLMQREIDAAGGGKGAKTVKLELDPDAARRKAQADRAEAMQSALQKTVMATTPKGLGAQQKAFDPSAKPGAANGKQGAASGKPATPGSAGKTADTKLAKLTEKNLKLNSTEIRLHDTTIRLNSLDAQGGGNPGVAGIRLNSTEIRLHDTAIQLKDTSFKLHDLAIKLKVTGARLNDPLSGMHSTALSVNSAIVALCVPVPTLADPAHEENSAVSAPGIATVQRCEMVLKAKNLPASFIAAAGERVQMPTDKLARARQSAELTVLILSIRGDQLFEWGSTALRSDAEPGLREVAAVLICRGNQPVLVRGCADGGGDAQAEASLAVRRAVVIRDWLVANGGIAERKSTVLGPAVTESVASNKKSKGAEVIAVAGREPRVTITVAKAI